MAEYRKRNSTIGLDYGTHSTKVVHRVRGEGIGRVIRFDRSCDGYPINAAPSVIRESDGMLYFGTLAVELTGGEDYGSLKADLLHRTDDHALDRKIDILSAGYIAWALGEILHSDAQLTADNPIIQVSAPTSHAGNKELEERYLRIVHASYVYVKSYLRVEQGVNFQWLSEVMSPLLDAEVPARAERRFFVAPETIAPIVSLQLEPIIESGIFLIADMGAATTEMSICAVNAETSGRVLLAYSDSTELRGGNELGEIDGMFVGASQQRLESFLNALRSQAHRVWANGFMKDSNNLAARRRWRRLQVLLTGGATHHKDVRSFFNDKIVPHRQHFLDDATLSIDRHYPATLKFDEDFGEDDRSLFAVANGLSVQRAEWPHFFGEDEIKDLEKRRNDAVELIPSYLEIG